MTISNELGAVPIFDFGTPRVITAYAMEAISGGELVFASGATGVVSSGADSYVASDITVATGASGANFLGMALKNTESGAACPVASEGAFLVKCSGSVFGGLPVGVDGTGGVANLGSLVVPANAEDAGMAGRKVGRAITAGASGLYALVGFNAF